MDLATQAVLVGTGATALLDLWTLARRAVTGTPVPDYGLVGRWFGHMARGRFRHESIAANPAFPGELAIGWIAHYVIGIAYAFALLWLTGPRPTLWASLAFGVATVLAPFLLMQPGMGLGIAASRAPNPRVARLRSLNVHAVFGISLYLAALLYSLSPLAGRGLG